MQAATATLHSRHFVSRLVQKAAVYLKSPRDQNTERDLRRTCDDERPKFDPPHLIAIAISVATIERLYLRTRRRQLAQSETAGD